MVKKSFVEEKKAAGAIAHTVGLTKERYFEKLEELGLNRIDSFVFAYDYFSSVPFGRGRSFDTKAIQYCMKIGNERYSRTKKTGDCFFIIRKNDKPMAMECIGEEEYNVVYSLAAYTDGKERHDFLAFIEGDDGMFYCYGDMYSGHSRRFIA